MNGKDSALGIQIPLSLLHKALAVLFLSHSPGASACEEEGKQIKPVYTKDTIIINNPKGTTMITALFKGFENTKTKY